MHLDQVLNSANDPIFYRFCRCPSNSISQENTYRMPLASHFTHKNCFKRFLLPASESHFKCMTFLRPPIFRVCLVTLMFSLLHETSLGPSPATKIVWECTVADSLYISFRLDPPFSNSVYIFISSARNMIQGPAIPETNKVKNTFSMLI
jgi:hypothetical protein